MQKKVLTVIPAYNEERNIEKVIKGIRENLENVDIPTDILVIDDFSSDKTSCIAKENGAIVLRHPFNMGYAPSCQTGFKYALLKGYKAVVQMDADGQHNPKSIPALLKPVIDGKVDLCIGSRFLDGCGYKTTIPRKIGMIIFSRIASILMGRKITDPTSGFQAFNRKVLKLYCTDVYPDDYPDANLLITMHFAGFKIKEVPVVMYPNPQKSMHNFLSSVFYFFKMMVAISISFFTKTYVINRIMEEDNGNKT